ncbi:MAG: iron ABC transporter permease [Oscillospiraceae bacterium]|nr:iron ABC transporter permease [Oscillospiraceae bacterium]
MSEMTTPIEMKKKMSYVALVTILICVLVSLFLFSIVSGRFDLGVGEVVRILLSRVFPLTPTWEALAETVIFQIRLPRIFAAMLIGAALATSGATYQGLFRNPMVSPDFLGVTSGASIGAALAIIMELPFSMVQIFAFFGGILATLITTSIPKMLRNQSNIVLVLSGIVVTGLFRSIMSVIRYLADAQTALASIVFWQMGSLSSVSPNEVMTVSLPMTISLIVLIRLAWWINIMSLGEVQSTLLGVNFKRYRRVGILCSTALAVLSVCIAGEVGWVGLAVPHLSRLMVGVDNKKVIPVCALLGAIFLLIVDTLARTLTTAEIPLGVLTGVVGAPVFIFLLYRQKTRLQ